MRVIEGPDQLRAAVGEELGVSPWHEITQAQIDAFGAATEDTYWIHVDPERAARSDLGHTIAHGLLTLSLGPKFTYSIVSFEGFEMVLNYGFDKVRLPDPVPVGSRVRMRSKLEKVEEDGAGARVTLAQTFERHGGSKPVCIASSVLMLIY